MFEQPRPRPLACRATVILGLMGVMAWAGSVACLWTYESTLIFQARRSRFPRSLASEGLIQLRTTDGIRLDALSLTHEGASRYWILFAAPSAILIDVARALFQRFPGRKRMLELSGGHNNVGFAGDESLGRALAQFWPNPG